MTVHAEFLRPSAHLARSVAYYYALEAPPPPCLAESAWLSVLPVPHVQLVVSWGDAADERTLDGPARESPPFALTGFQTRTVSYRARGRLGVLMVGFHPWGLRPYLQAPSPPLVDCNLALDSLFVASRVLESEVRQAPDLAARVAAVERFLWANLRQPALDQPVVEAVERILESRGRVSVEELAADCALGRRQFLRRFRQAVGVEPRLFSQVVRFQRAFEALDQHGQQPDWGRIAHEAGYCDQSHFIHAFRAFTGDSPASYHRRVQRSDLGRDFDAQVQPGDPMRRMYE
ncbi:AraC family transcriptional regulator [Myxococcota bacterium]|nr:AraC family transcriptional regulator [Myxococcota bacterium]